MQKSRNSQVRVSDMSVKIKLGSKRPTAKQLSWCQKNLGPQIVSLFSRETGENWRFYRPSTLNSSWYAEFPDEETATLFLLST